MTRLVGRATELAELEKELQQASRGEFRCVLLSAGPGIGKTRLGTELLARNRRRTIGLSARAYPLGRTASLGLWAEALDCHLRNLPSEKVTALCGGFLEDLAGLLRSVAAAHGSTPAQETPRFRLFEGLAVLVKNLAARAPVTVVLDDLHHADGSSWEALNYLAHNLPEARVLVVGAARPVELAEQPVGIDVVLGLEQEGMLRRLALAPLGPEGVAELAEAVLHSQPPEPLVAWLFERSQGNPLFVLGLLRALIDEGADLAAPALRHLPEGLAERVASRLKLLDEPAIATLEMLAVLGRPVELAALATLSDRPLERLGEILEDLVGTRRIVEERQSRPLTYEIVHPLVQDAVYQGIGGARRRTLHRLAARALLASGRVAEAAEHFARSADPGDDEAIEALREAVRQAEAQAAYGEALTILIALMDLLPAGDSRWLDVLGAASFQGEWVVLNPAGTRLAIGALRAVDAGFGASSSVTTRATAKLRLGGFLAWALGEGAAEEADRLLEEGIRLFEEVGDRGGALLTANQRIWLRYLVGDWKGAADRARTAVLAADAAGERLVAAEARYVLGAALMITGRFAEGESLIRHAIATTRDEGHAHPLAIMLPVLAFLLGLEGRMHEALGLLREVKTLNPLWRETFVPVSETFLDWLAGDFPSVIAGAREALAASPGGLDKMRSLRLSFAAMAAAEGDRTDEAGKLTGMARSAYRDGDWCRCAGVALWADAVVAWREGRHSEALTSLTGVATAFSGESWNPARALALIDHAEIAAESGDAAAACRAADALEEVAQRVDRELYRALAAIGSAWSCLACGDHPGAAARAADALELLRPIGYRVLTGRALDLLGRSLSMTDRDKALKAYREAVEVFEACQAVRRANQSREALRQLGSPGRRALAASLGPTSLTRREREVARLASQGLTARQVAEQLFISERTVETHLTNVYAKLGVESKLDLVHRAGEFVF